MTHQALESSSDLQTAAPASIVARLEADARQEASKAAPRVLVKPKGIPVLDGWRGISILCVLATHMLPLGPRGWGNAFMGPAGMSLFFTLSGFLIISTLLEKPDARQFLIRRACRILPLAFLYIAVGLAVQGKGFTYYVAHLLFLINYDHTHITGLTSHFWSLCVEVHFYLFVGLLVAMAGRRGLMLLPLVCLVITGLRIASGSLINIKTHLRVDEILAGACLALVYQHCMGLKIRWFLKKVSQPPLIVLLLLASYPGMGPLNYLRPYCAAALVGTTLFRPANALHRVLAGRVLGYIAAVSYALYVVHKLSMCGWLGSGGGWERYLVKRPVSFMLTLAAAHLSTFHLEKWWVAWGKKASHCRFLEAEKEMAVL